MTFWKHFLEALKDLVYIFTHGKEELETSVPVVVRPPEPPEPTQPTPSEKLLTLSEEYENTDPSPADKVDDVVACVDSLTNVIIRLYPNFPKSYYTPILLADLKKSPFFKETSKAESGSVILNATGTGNGTLRGHCGVIGRNGRIRSNDSRTGLWTDYYTIETWQQRYRLTGGMPTHIFEPI